MDKAQRSVDGQSPTPSFSSAAGSKPSGSELYQQAMANVNAHQNAGQGSSTHISPLAGGARKNVGAGGYGGSVPKIPHYPTAEQEKEALKRYEEAKMAVDRIHNPYDSNGAEPIAYDSLYPKAGGSSSGVGAGAADAPPSFEASVNGSNVNTGLMSALAEKAALAERMRLEEADTAMQNQAVAPPPSFHAVQVNMDQQYRDAAAEKEDIRKKLEAKDAAAAAKRARHQQQRQHSSRNQQQQQQPLPVPQQPRPQPPTNAQILTAAEEKAMLKAKLEAKDAARMGQKKVNGMPTPPASPRPQPTSFHAPSPQLSSQQQRQQQQLLTPISPPTHTPLSPPPPPPLMPRPPADYIRETREEDERVSRVVIDGASFDDEDVEGGGVNGNGGGHAAGIYMNGNASGSLSKKSLVMVPGPPPPLPPKPAGE